jgi:hypothetical protein
MEPGYNDRPVALPGMAFLCLWLTFALALYVLSTIHLGTWIFWDAEVYARALHDWQIGQNPYNSSDPLLLFVYPPVVLHIGGFLARHLPEHFGWLLYLIIYVACSLALPYVLARFYLRQPWMTPALAYVLAVMQPRFAWLGALRTGNLTSICYFAALVAALPGMRKNRWEYFYLVTFLIVAIKINFFVMLLIPLLIGQRQWLWSSLCALCAFAAYPLQQSLNRPLFEGFRNAVSQQIAGNQAYGYGVMRFAVNLETAMHHAVDVIPYLLLAVFALAIVSAMFLLRRRLQATEGNPLWPALVLLAAMLCNPRILPYDSDIALLAAVVLLISALRTHRILLVAAILFLPPVILQIATHHSVSGLYEISVCLISFAAGYRMLWNSVDHSRPVPA